MAAVTDFREEPVRGENFETVVSVAIILPARKLTHGSLLTCPVGGSADGQLKACIGLDDRLNFTIPTWKRKRLHFLKLTYIWTI
jgi:hypothetical protein